MENNYSQENNIQNIGHDFKTVDNFFDYCKDNVNDFLRDNPKITNWIFGGLAVLSIIGAAIYENQKTK